LQSEQVQYEIYNNENRENSDTNDNQIIRSLKEQKKIQNSEFINNNTKSKNNSELYKNNKLNDTNKAKVNELIIKKDKVPPLYVYHKQIQVIKQAIIENLKIKEFNIKKINANKYAIFSQNIEIYKKNQKFINRN